MSGAGRCCSCGAGHFWPPFPDLWEHFLTNHLNTSSCQGLSLGTSPHTSSSLQTFDGLAWVTAGQPAYLNRVTTTPGAGKEMGFPSESEGCPDLSSRTHTPMSSLRAHALPRTPRSPPHAHVYPQLLGGLAAHVLPWEPPLSKVPSAQHASSKARLLASLRDHSFKLADFTAPGLSADGSPATQSLPLPHDALLSPHR